MLSWITRTWKRARTPRVPESVTFDDERITRTRSDGCTESIRWADLAQVTIVTTDEGPWLDDLFWLLTGDAGGCVVPSEAAGTAQLLERLQTLPGFDDAAVIMAMGSTSDDRFLVWKRAADGAAPEPKP